MLSDTEKEELNGYNLKVKKNNKLQYDINDKIKTFDNSTEKNESFLYKQFLAFNNKKIFN